MNQSQMPLRLLPNRVSYLLPGGALIDRFLNQPVQQNGTASQMWVASVVQSALPGAASTLSHISPQDGGGCLARCLQEEPAAFLGEKHAKTFGANPGFLLKLLHSSQRLLVQTHPNDAQAKKYFGQPCGKTEAWYVLDTDKAAGPAYVWVGFLPHVQPAYFRGLIEAQDTAAILACLHRFEIEPGDVILLPAGMPHALGAGSLVAEIQQPVDLTLRAECIRPDGTRLPRQSLHSGAGMDALLDCFDFSAALPRQAIRTRCFLQPTAQKQPGGLYQQLVGSPETACFQMNRRVCLAPDTIANPGFRVLLVEKGSGTLCTKAGRAALQQGNEVFLPAGVTEYTLVPNQKLVVLECLPPV